MDWFWQAILLLMFTVPVFVLFGYAVWDVLRRPDAGVGLRVVWLVVFCVLPIIGPLVYLAIRPPGTTAEQRTALTLGHAAPHAPLDLVVEGLGEALGANGAPGAQLLGLVLLGTTDEELVGLRLPARRAGGPVLDPHSSALPSPR